MLCMSMKGETCMALGTFCPSGLKRKVTLAPQGVLVTSAMHMLCPPPGSKQWYTLMGFWVYPALTGVVSKRTLPARLRMYCLLTRMSKI